MSCVEKKENYFGLDFFLVFFSVIWGMKEKERLLKKMLFGQALKFEQNGSLTILQSYLLSFFSSSSSFLLPLIYFLLSSFFSIILIPLPILPYFLFPSLRASDDGRESSISSDVCVCRDYGEESYISVNFITRVADDLMFLLTYNLIVLLMT